MRFPILVILCLGLSLLTAHAQTNAAAPAVEKVPGEQIAQTISLITGVAISPLMGVGAIGAWEFFHARTPEQKAKLHWFANPFFWVPALLLVAACFVKDTAGTALPAILKKPLDVADAIENKISGLVAMGAFVPIAAAIFSPHGSNDGASLSAAGFAAIDLSPLYNALMIPIAMVVFFIVAIASNTINILILLSPFPVVDALLKLFRTLILISVAVSAWANPWMGAAWALVIILFSWLIAGWSFRLSYFGFSFIWDFVTGRSNRFKPNPTTNKMFLGAGKFSKVPTRTYGRLSRNEKGALVFTYRPWLILANRSVTLPEGRYAAGKGLFYSEILQLDGDKARMALLLPPRYRSHEYELVAIYGLTDVRDTGLLAVLKQWMKFMLGFKTKTTAA